MSTKLRSARTKLKDTLRSPLTSVTFLHLYLLHVLILGEDRRRIRIHQSKERIQERQPDLLSMLENTSNLFISRYEIHSIPIVFKGNRAKNKSISKAKQCLIVYRPAKFDKFMKQ